nr:uncharacterized protein LOC113829172 [Penaeus vannamei]
MFVCMLSHGIDRDTFYTSDMKRMDVSAVSSSREIKLLHKKKKTFRTHQEFPTIYLRQTARSRNLRRERSKEPEKDEAPRDMLTLYASTEGFKAFRVSQGTFFVLSLCKVLAAHAHNTDMLTMAQKLDQVMTARRRATTPEAQSFAFKKLFLNPLKPSAA